MHDSARLPNSRFHSPKFSLLKSIGIKIGAIAFPLLLTACDTAIATRYEATALVTSRWQVGYTTTVGGGGERPPRLETFASTSVVNRNGQQPDEPTSRQDDRGLWLPPVPPRPTVDEMEQRRRDQESIGTPELITDVKYSFTYEKDGQMVTLPTNYSVYRQVARSYPDQTPLQLTLGINDASVEKAEPQ